MSNVQAHICLDDTVGIRCALLPGDPKRIDRITPFLTDVRELVYNREFRSVSGNYKGLPVLCVSTGIGGASAAIAVEELKNIGVTHMIRIGSCGALQEGIGLGELILVSGAVRDDGASKMYVDPIYPAVPDSDLLFAVRSAAEELGLKTHTGIARSHDSFYTDFEDERHAKWQKTGVLGCDMETAALYTVGRLRGVKTMSILNNVVVAGEDTADSIGGYVDGESLTMKGERDEIVVALEALRKVLG
ncbi:MAG: nucleoside phosphorylase [Clostridia bacterium]|nr:nucleoside phosphorylase [Clostridia bacterium]